MQCLNIETGKLDQSLDKYLDYFDNTRNEILRLMILYPKTISSQLWNPQVSPIIDKDCQCEVGNNLDIVGMKEKKEYTKTQNRIMSRNNRCRQCSLLYRLLADGDNTNEIKVESGDNRDRIYKLNIFKSVSLIMKWNKSNKAFGSNNNKYIGFLELDKFTSSILSNWYAEEVLLTSEIYGLVNTEIGFVCGRNGYNLREKSSISSWSKISKEYLDNSNYDTHRRILISLWLQLFSILHRLSKYNFDCTYFSDETINLQIEPTDYEYDNIHIKNNITMKLNLPEGCNIDVFTDNEQNEYLEKDRYRIYNNNKIDSIINKNPFSISTRNIKYVDCNVADYCITINKCFVQINNNKYSNISTFKRYVDYGMFSNSIVTTYLCILTIMSDLDTFRTVMDNDDLYDFWVSLWHPDDYDRVHSKMKQMVHTNPTLKDKLSIIAPSKMRCNISDHAWIEIKKLHYNLNNKNKII